MKSGTFTNNTSFTASAAQVNISTGSTEASDGDMFTVPDGVHIIRVYWSEAAYDDKSGSVYTYVEVTPGKTYELSCYTFVLWPNGDSDNAIRDGVYLGSTRPSAEVTWFQCFPDSNDIQDIESIGGFTLSWSSEINEMMPTYTDY